MSPSLSCVAAHSSRKVHGTGKQFLSGVSSVIRCHAFANTAVDWQASGDMICVMLKEL